MPVVNSRATHTPPISAARTRKLTSVIVTNGITKKLNPKRSRVASTRVCLLTAAKRPAISTRKMIHSPPRTTAHVKRKPNSAPACAAVVIEPTSRKPPTLVTMPKAISNILLMGSCQLCQENDQPPPVLRELVERLYQRTRLRLLHRFDHPTDGGL